MKNKTVLKSLIPLLMIVLISMTVMPVHASYWHDLTDNERNQLILDEVQSQVGCYGGQCKVWVQNVVWTASWNTVWLPLNYYNPGDTYHLARWDPENSDVSVVLRSTLLISNYYWMFKPGQIIQMRHHDGASNTPHTMIIKSATYYGFTVIDSNWYSDGYVHEHWISSSWFASYTDAWTVYQIK